MEKISDFIISYFDNKIKRNSENTYMEESMLSFYSLNKPIISTGDYIERLIQYCEIPVENHICVIIYIDRLEELLPKPFCINENNFNRIYCSCLLICIKVVYDSYYTNSFYAKVFGISLKELNKIELEMLKLLDYDISIQRSVYQGYTSVIKLV